MPAPEAMADARGCVGLSTRNRSKHGATVAAGRTAGPSRANWSGKVSRSGTDEWVPPRAATNFGQVEDVGHAGGEHAGRDRTPREEQDQRGSVPPCDELRCYGRPTALPGGWAPGWSTAGLTGGQGRPTGLLIGGPTGRPGGGPTGVLGGGPTGVLGGGPTGRLIGGLTGGLSTGEHGGGVADADWMAPVIATTPTAGTNSAAVSDTTRIDDLRRTFVLLRENPTPVGVADRTNGFGLGAGGRQGIRRRRRGTFSTRTRTSRPTLARSEIARPDTDQSAEPHPMETRTGPGVSESREEHRSSTCQLPPDIRALWGAEHRGHTACRPVVVTWMSACRV